MKTIKLFIFWGYFFCSLMSLGQKKIDLSYQNLKTVPDSIRLLTQVEELDFSGNPLQELPHWLSALKGLKKITLNEVSTLPIGQTFEILSHCEELTSLSWKSGKLIFLPICIQKFKVLSDLNLADNGIYKLPKLLESCPLKNLDLSKNLIDTLPPSIVNLGQLQTVNFSFNPGTNTEMNYHLLGQLVALKDLTIQGCKTFPNKLVLLRNLERLSLSNSSLHNIPPEISALKNLKSIDVNNCPNIPIATMAENLAALPLLKSLSFGGSNTEKIPYNLFKLQSLESLTISNTCLKYFPAAIKKMKINRLILHNCTLITGSNFHVNCSGIKTLKSLSIKSLIDPESSSKLHLWFNLDSLDLSNCKLTFFPSALNKLKWLNITGNKIPTAQLKSFKGKVVDSNQEQLMQPSAIKLTPLFKKNIPDFSSSSGTFRKVIYTHIGDQFKVHGVNFYFPPEAFLDRYSKIIDGEVIVEINCISKAHEIAKGKIPLMDQKNNLINPNKIISFNAYQLVGPKNREKKEIVFINQKNKVQISILDTNVNMSAIYQFDKKNNKWQQVKSLPLTCKKPPTTLPKSSFRTHAFKNLAQYPTPSFQVRNSKVQLRLKRNKKRKSLLFEITPEYGYKENFFQLFGDRIKGYPELKVFKGLKWKYVGLKPEKILKELYFLSEQADQKKLERKSSFYFYVLDLKNIFIVPHPSKDSYLMNIVQGKDTLKLDVLPQLKLMKPRKTQKWHRKKYSKYNKKLLERILYWEKLDSIHFNNQQSFEKKLANYRLKLLDTYRPAVEKNKSVETNLTTSFETDKKGSFMMGTPLLLNQGKRAKINLKISNRTHHGKLILVRNASSKQTYWQNRNSTYISDIGTHFVFSNVGNNLYVGKCLNNDSVQLNKFVK